MTRTTRYIHTGRRPKPALHDLPNIPRDRGVWANAAYRQLSRVMAGVRAALGKLGD